MEIVLLGLALLALAASRPDPKKKVPPEAQALFNTQGGRLAYKREVADMILASLLSKQALPGPTPEVMIVQPGPPGGIVGADNWGAYWAVMGLHQQGNNIWVPQNFHLPIAVPQPVIFGPPGMDPPPEFALLIGANNVWPQLPAQLA